jgi:hypothetical protein
VKPNDQPTREDAMTITAPVRTASTSDSSATLKAVPRTKIKRFLNTLMKSLAAAHA